MTNGPYKEQRRVIAPVDPSSVSTFIELCGFGAFALQRDEEIWEIARALDPSLTSQVPTI